MLLCVAVAVAVDYYHYYYYDLVDVVASNCISQLQFRLLQTDYVRLCWYSSSSSLFTFHYTQLKTSVDVTECRQWQLSNNYFWFKKKGMCRRM